MIASPLHISRHMLQLDGFSPLQRETAAHLVIRPGIGKRDQTKKPFCKQAQSEAAEPW
jgi:hypothetical protein